MGRRRRSRAGVLAGRVLSTNTGFARNYGFDPYQGYEFRPGTLFPVGEIRDDLPEKEWVFGILVEGEARAYPLAELERTPEIVDVLAGVTLELSFDAAAVDLVVIRRDTGEQIPAVQSFWFAWQGFEPDTTVWAPDD